MAFTRSGPVMVPRPADRQVLPPLERSPSGSPSTPPSFMGDESTNAVERTARVRQNSFSERQVERKAASEQPKATKLLAPLNSHFLRFIEDENYEGAFHLSEQVDNSFDHYCYLIKHLYLMNQHSIATYLLESMDVSTKTKIIKNVEKLIAMEQVMSSMQAHNEHLKELVAGLSPEAVERAANGLWQEASRLGLFAQDLLTNIAAAQIASNSKAQQAPASTRNQHLPAAVASQSRPNAPQVGLPPLHNSSARKSPPSASRSNFGAGANKNNSAAAAAANRDLW